MQKELKLICGLICILPFLQIGCVSQDFEKRSAVLVVGEVRKPGFQACAQANQTLLGWISAAGGLTERAYTKEILVIDSGVTNVFNYWSIKRGMHEDPEVSCGSKILVKKMAPFLQH